MYRTSWWIAGRQLYSLSSLRQVSRSLLIKVNMSSGTRLIGKTLSYEEKLPPLPVPTLKQSCMKYLESVKPCVSEKEFAITKAKILEFCQGVGPILQKKLEEKALHSKNWLEKWWEDYAYLRPRYPIAPIINISGPFVLFEDIWPAEDGTQMTRSTILLYYLLKEWKLLYSQERSVDCKGDIPYSMSQYYRLMSWCRIPGHTVDTYVEALKPAPAPAVNYITVLVKGRIYKCVVLNAELNPITIPEMESQLKFILEDASKKPAGPGLSSLTSENRSVWAKLCHTPWHVRSSKQYLKYMKEFKEREHLLANDPRHSEMLDIIQKSIMTLVLDDSSPSSLNEVQSFLNGGNCHNRWFDKSFQLIAFKNGLLGVNIDHAAYDGIVETVTVARATDNVKKYWKKSKEGNLVKYFPGSFVRPVELEFQLDDHLHKSIKKATEQFQVLSASSVNRSFVWRTFGKKVIQQFNLHPDTFIQMAIQLADYKLHKRISPTYETASTRQFYHGRTDTVRSYTKETQHWCKVMEDPQAMVSLKVKLLRIACLRHDELVKEATNGSGIDRHLMGLKIIAEESGLPIPEIFTDAAWTKSGGDGNFIISTSLMGYNMIVYGVALPMVEDGYGSFYSIQDERVTFTVTTYRSSKITDCERFVKSLQESLLDMQCILVESKL